MSLQLASCRRDFLHLLGCTGVALSLPVLARAQQGSPAIGCTRVGENAVVLTGAGANVLLVTRASGLLLVDDGLAERTSDLIKIIADLGGGRPVKLVFNTHWHAENTGSNEVFANAGAKIIAHENTKLTMGMDIFDESAKQTFKARPQEALPSETFYASTSMARKITFDGEPIEYGSLPQAHTDGDIYVFFPQPNILMAGGVVSMDRYPILDNSSGGWIGGMVRASKILLQVGNAETRVVPGHGPVVTRTALEAQSQMLSTVFDRLVKLMKQGMGPRDMIAAAPTKEFDEKWGDPELLITSAYRGLWGHARELGGII